MKKLTIALPALLLAGCGIAPQAPEKKPINWYVADPSDVAPVRRVMVLPFSAAAGVDAELGRIREAYLAELAKIQRFEVVPLPTSADDSRRIYASIERGKVSTDALVGLARRYRLDGIMVAEVTGYRAYLPPHLGLRAKLFSIHSGSWIWAAEGHYDAQDAATMQDLEHFQSSFLAKEETMHGVRMNLLSPTRFAAFVSHRIVGTWRDASR